MFAEEEEEEEDVMRLFVLLMLSPTRLSQFLGLSNAPFPGLSLSASFHYRFRGRPTRSYVRVEKRMRKGSQQQKFVCFGSVLRQLFENRFFVL